MNFAPAIYHRTDGRAARGGRREIFSGELPVTLTAKPAQETHDTPAAPHGDTAPSMDLTGVITPPTVLVEADGATRHLRFLISNFRFTKGGRG